MSRKRTIDNAFSGQHFGKIDLDRVGFFNDSLWGTFDVYQSPLKFFDDKGRQFLGGSADVFFENKFQRIFEGEALTEPWRDEVKERLQNEKKKIGGHMLPTSPSKKHSTPGDWYGCFDKPSYLSREQWMEARGKVLPNMKIKPNPLGGPGYVDICLNPYPSYSHEPYDHVTEKKVGKKRTSEGRFLTASVPLNYFPPNPYEDKKPGPTYLRPVEILKKRKLGKRAPFYVPFPKESGGNHAGCFSKFPEYYPDPYVKVKEKKKVTVKPSFRSGGPSLRSKYTNSIITQITRISCNARNYSEYREKAYPVY